MPSIRALIPALVICLAAAPALADVYCPKCGHRYPDSYNYCPLDGTDLAAARKAAQAQQGKAAGSDDGTKTATTQGKPSGSGQTSEPAPRSVLAAPPRTELQPPADWAADLPIHLPVAYPDANLGDFALYEWDAPGAAGSTIFLRAVLRKGEKGHVSVLLFSMPGPRAGAPPLQLQRVLDAVAPDRASRAEWDDYRDFARSFELNGRPLRSPFAGATKALRVSRKDFVIRGGTVGCDVTEYSILRGGAADRHVLWMSDQVPFAFVQSTYQAAGEKLRLILFGTLDSDQLAPLQRAFPGGGS
jgi:hypothetical protein